MAKNKFLTQLQDHEGAIVDRYDPHSNVLKTLSPSLNFTFGKGHGVPRGYTLALGGIPKGGKSLICHMFTGQIHAENDEDCVLKYDTEFREEVQATPEELQQEFGVDPDRYQVFQTNNPMGIFDHIEKDVAAQCQKGFKLAAVIIDSVNGIVGRRAMNADTVETQQIGDDAKTLGDGFKRILAVQRKYRFALILTCQVRAEMDKIEQMRGNKLKMSLPFAVQHYAEYFMFVEPDRNKDGKLALDGSSFTNEELGDIRDDGEVVGHKIMGQMKDSSCGPKKRRFEFTLDYHKGVVNLYEEVFKLGVNRGVIERPNNSTYIFQGKTWRGKENLWDELKADEKLRFAIVAELYKRDAAGVFDAADKADEEAESIEFVVDPTLGKR
jgi:RecA/RadA recombinase